MVVERVRVVGFRNLAEGEVALGEGIALISGPNGAGKTNLLEATYLALAGRSPRTRSEREALAFGAPLARVEAEVSDARNGERRTFLCALERSGERRHLLDGSPMPADAGELRPALAVFMPDRLVLVKGPPSARRSHLDRFCTALWPARAEARRAYSRALAQRNALLGRIRAGFAGEDSLDAWDRELAVAGVALIESRRAAAEHLREPFRATASELGLAGGASLAYRPRSEAAGADQLAAELASRREGDLARGFTTHGPHLDELELARAGRSLRRYGSQGQQRTALLALLFAEREALIATGRPPPLMLLDDVTSELDGERRERLCERLAQGGQALITATESAHLPASAPRRELGLRDGRVIAPVDAREAA